MSYVGYDMDQVAEKISGKIKHSVVESIKVGNEQMELRIAQQLHARGNLRFTVARLADQINEIDKRLDEVKRLQRDDPGKALRDLAVYEKRYGVKVRR